MVEQIIDGSMLYTAFMYTVLHIVQSIHHILRYGWILAPSIVLYILYTTYRVCLPLPATLTLDISFFHSGTVLFDGPV